MRKHNVLLSNLIIVLQTLMLLFSIVDLNTLPSWVKYAGKFHPLLLHLPIVLILLLIPITWLLKKYDDDNSKALQNSIELLLLYNALIATIAAIGGLLLASSDSYDQETLTWHKWSGIAVAVCSHGLVYLYKYLSTDSFVWKLSLGATVIALIMGSHFGGTLTHGEGYLSFFEESLPLASVPEFTDSTTVFEGAIQPVVAAKCLSCHNDKKSKGGLNFSSLEKMLKGGKTGALWVSGDPDQSTMVSRMLLDMDDKKHMPPKGKAQLTSNEIELFREWIRAGANASTTYHSLAEGDTLKKIVTAFVASTKTRKPEKIYTFEAASAATISSLNSPFRRILPLAYNSPALSVKFFLKEKFDLNLLKECNSISKQIVEVNLSTMPVTDEAFKTIATFENLETLNLNGTSITGKGLLQLSANKNLSELSLANTSVDLSSVKTLSALPQLKKVYLWNSKISENDIVALNKEFPRTSWDAGFIPDKNELLKLTPPYLADKEKTILDKGELIALKHPLPGVVIRYSLDGIVPDTINGKVYTTPFLPASGLVRVIAVATRDGWISSNKSDNTFFIKGKKCDSVKLVNPTHNRYKGLGAVALTDLKKGFAENQDNLYSNWLGFREINFKTGFYFNGESEISEIVISTADMTRGYVMPPQKIIIKAGDTPEKLKLIGQLTPEQPSEYRGNSNIPYSMKVAPGKYRYIEIEAIPVQKLPKWHTGKGEKGWVFVDEVFFY
jgi:uncharacterized membrane protein